MRLRPLARIALAVLLGTVAALLLLEAGLRVAHVFRPDTAPAAVPAARPGQRTVLCIGDSFVQGFGVADMRRDSYPAQLQRLFDREAPGAVRVLNTGTGGENLYQIRRRFIADLERLPRPEAVVLLGGMIQGDNTYGFYRYLFPGNPLFAALDLINRSSVVRLARYLGTAAHEKKQREYKALVGARLPATPAARAHAERCGALLEKGDAAGAVRELSAALEDDPAWRAGTLALLEFTRTDPELFLREFDRRRSRAPADSTLWEWVGEAHAARGEYAAAFAACREGLKTPWGPPRAERRNCYGAITRLYRSVPDPRLRRRIRLFALTQFCRAPQFTLSLFGFASFHASMDGWIEYEISRIHEACRARGIPFVLQTYPGGAPERSALLRAVGRRRGIPVVDHELLFRDVPRDGYISRLDGVHCNERGYALMARQVRDALVRRYPSLVSGDSDPAR